MSVARLSQKTRKNTYSLEKGLSKEDVSRILGMVPRSKAFFFYDGIGKPTGDFAVSLSDFCNKIGRVSMQSLTFHFRRGDFQRWIGETVGDADLARRIGRIRVKNGALRETLHAYIHNRIRELKDAWPVLLTITG